MLPIVHYAVSRSQAGVYYAIRRHPGGQYICECVRYQFSKKPKHCSHTEWAAYEEETMNQQRKGGFDYGKTDYVEVAERVQQFYERYPDGSLDTEWPPQIITVGGGEFIAVRALAYRTPDDPRPGVGVAWEPVPGTTSFTKNSELMNAQTAAWGRAIAALGFATKGSLASSEEVRNRQAEREVPPPPSRRQGGLRERVEGAGTVDTGTGEIVEDEPRRTGYPWEGELRAALEDKGFKGSDLGLSKGDIDGMIRAGQSIDALVKIAADNVAARQEVQV